MSWSERAVTCGKQSVIQCTRQIAPHQGDEAMSWSRLAWMNGKTSLARHLADGECGGAYAEAVIILVAAISAIAADSWPGAGIDRKRFVQLLIDSGDPRFQASRISVPLLLGNCRDSGQAVEEHTLRSRFMDYPSSQVLSGSHVDQNELTILTVCPALSRPNVRRFSYANLFYTEVRSTLVHEYRFGRKADPVTMLEDEAPDAVSYGNWWGEKDRHIHFPIEWVCGVASSVAGNVDMNASNTPLPAPSKWWLEEL